MKAVTPTNPFLQSAEFHLRAVQVYKRSYQGQGHFMEETTRKYIVEEQAKVSMYKIGNSSEFTTFLFSVLNQSGRNLFLYLMANIGENKDIINLNTEKLTKAMGVSRNTHYSALESLRDNGVITLYRKDEYWVNPFFVFRGDRIAYYQEQCPDRIKIVSKVTTGELLSGKM
jgi:Firmicute plasmid replication protein (RepL)